MVTLTLTLWPINSGVLTSLLLPHLSSSLTDSLPSLNLLYHSKTHAWSMQDGRKAVWSIPNISVAFFPNFKQNFIAYRSTKVSWRPDYIFEIHQLWQSGFSRVYSNCCCSCWFEAEIIEIGQSSHKMYRNNIVNFHWWTLYPLGNGNFLLIRIFRQFISMFWQIYFSKTFWRCPLCNGYRRRKWTRRHEFKFAIHIALIPLGKVWI